MLIPAEPFHPSQFTCRLTYVDNKGWGHVSKRGVPDDWTMVAGSINITAWNEYELKANVTLTQT